MKARAVSGRRSDTSRKERNASIKQAIYLIHPSPYLSLPFPSHRMHPIPGPGCMYVCSSLSDRSRRCREERDGEVKGQGQRLLVPYW